MNHLKNSRILITGGVGFIGSTIADLLLEEEVQEIILLDNLVRGNTANIEKALPSGKVRFVEGDIRDRSLLEELSQDIDYCFHMAALRITHCAEQPRECLEVMYDGTFNVLEACVKANVRKLVLASTASVYGMADEFPTKETHHPYNNTTLYGAAKAANELMCRAFHDMSGLNYTALRFFNVYGPRMDTYGKYTEVLIRWYRLLKEGKRPLIFGDGKQTMDFIYVGEVARANILALKAGVRNDVFNIASQIETSLEELCLSLIKVMRVNITPEYIPLPAERKKVEVLRRLADTSNARDVLGFESQVPLQDGLQKLVEWLDSIEVSS